MKLAACLHRIRQLRHRRRQSARRRPRAAAASYADAPLPLADADDARCGCGWFESSHELHAGLQVIEHVAPNAVSACVPLGWWLDWQLCAAPGVGRAPAPRQAA